MIASVVVTLDKNTSNYRETLHQISLIPCVSIDRPAEFQVRVPVMIDSTGPYVLEEITRCLQSIPGVVFVDVVFVHFEDDPEGPSETPFGKLTSL